MSARIWKWPLAIIDAQLLHIPRGAEILTVQMQHGAPQLWAICDPEAPKAERCIAIYGTGNRIPRDDPGKYIATFQYNGGALVFHVFEISP